MIDLTLEILVTSRVQDPLLAQTKLSWKKQTMTIHSKKISTLTLTGFLTRQGLRWIKEPLFLLVAILSVANFQLSRS